MVVRHPAQAVSSRHGTAQKVHHFNSWQAWAGSAVTIRRGGGDGLVAVAVKAVADVLRRGKALAELGDTNDLAQTIIAVAACNRPCTAHKSASKEGRLTVGQDYAIDNGVTRVCRRCFDGVIP